jgi:hypothetical protein
MPSPQFDRPLRRRVSSTTPSFNALLDSNLRVRRPWPLLDFADAFNATGLALSVPYTALPNVQSRTGAARGPIQ